MAASETLSVQLPADLADALRQSVEAGEYADVAAAVVDALSAWNRRVEEREEDAAWVRAKVSAAFADPRPGMTSQEVKAHLEAFFERAERSTDEAA